MYRKRKYFRRRINGKLSKKHYTWVTAINTKCALTCLSTCTPEGEAIYCCPSSAQLVLLDNAVIQSSFQDAIRVVRIHGSLTFNWNLAPVLNALQILAANYCNYTQLVYSYGSTFAGIARSGIAIREVHNGDLTTLPRMNPIEDFDFSEGRWKQMRFHNEVTRQQFGLAISEASCPITTTANGVCSDVAGTSPGATTTSCVVTALPPVTTIGQWNKASTAMPGPFTWRYNNKLNLRVRENQLPVMSIGWSNVDFGLGQLPPPGLCFIGGLKLLIEVG